MRRVFWAGLNLTSFADGAVLQIWPFLILKRGSQHLSNIITIFIQHKIDKFRPLQQKSICLFRYPKLCQSVCCTYSLPVFVSVLPIGMLSAAISALFRQGEFCFYPGGNQMWSDILKYVQKELNTKQKYHNIDAPIIDLLQRPPRFLWLSSNCWDVYRVRLGGRVKLGLLQSIIAPQAPTSVHKSSRPMKKSSPRAGRAIRVDFAKRPPGAGNWQQLKPPASPLCSSFNPFFGWQIRRNQVKLGRLEWIKALPEKYQGCRQRGNTIRTQVEAILQRGLQGLFLGQFFSWGE